MNTAGVPCGPILPHRQAFADPPSASEDGAAGAFTGLGDLTILGHPVSHGERRQPIRMAAPELGQDNEEILTAIGYSRDQIADLAKRGII
jgi:formyl-CoA transferase